jgi:hypothetical protein
MTAKIKLNAASGGGSFSLQAPSSSANNRVFTIPDEADATLLTSNTSTGKILQVVQAAKTDTASTTSGTYVTISGLSVNITPSATSSKILVIADVKAGNDGGNGYYLQIVRDSTAIYVGDAATGKQQCIQQTYGGGDTGEGLYGMAKMGGTFLDSPNTTSQVTYAVQFLRLGGNSPQTLYVNRVGSESAGQYVGRAASSITAIEVAA